MARENKTRYAILGILSKRPLSGYDIRKLLTDITNLYWSESNAQIYPTLKQLELEGMLCSEIDSRSGARQRRLYQITPEGREQLRQWLQSPVSQAKERNELLLKLASGDQANINSLISHLDSYSEVLLEKEKRLTKKLEHINQRHANKPEQPYLLMTYDYVKHMLQAQEAWQQSTLAQLKKMASEQKIA